MPTPLSSGRATGPSTELPILTTKTAPSLSLTHGKVPNNAPNLGNAEVLDFAREADGAPAMMAVKELPFLIKPLDSLPTTDSSTAM